MKKIRIEILCDEFYVADSLHELATNIECEDLIDYTSENVEGITINGDHYTADINIEQKPVRYAVVFGQSAARRYEDRDYEGLHEALRNGDGSVLIRKFNSQQEKEAYMMGIDDGDGWCDYSVVDEGDIDKVQFDDI